MAVVEPGSVAESTTKGPPTLTDAQADKLRVAVQRVEIAQLKFQIIKLEFEQAQREAQALVRSLAVDGYELNPETLAYVPTTGAK